jgi:CO/xanthine dehydrogenase Mo-binding subunit
MAGERFHLPVDRLRVNGGVVSSASAPEQRVTYAQLVEGKRIERHVEKAPWKQPAAFTVIGTSPRRKDAFDKVTGGARYAADFRSPGMLHARILRPPAHGATLRKADTSAAENIDGVTVVREGDFLAVLHPRPDVAETALRAVQAQFDGPQTELDDRSIFDHLLEHSPAPQLVGESGSIGDGEKLAAAIIEETYLNSYVAHAPIETHSALAMMENGKITVWASTQTPFPLKQQVSQALGMPPDHVRVIASYVGGGFGGKSASQQAVEAARLAKITGRPVQVVLDRSEEFFLDTFRPAAVVKIRSGLTRDGRIAFWDYQVWGAGEREARTFYDIPHQRTRSSGGWQGGNPPGLHPFAIGAWRAPSVNTNTFARESHIDTLAWKAGVDPLAFRLNHLSDPRMRRALEAVAAKFGWQPAAKGCGVACGMYSGAYVATMAEVAVDPANGHVQVKRVATAIDVGLIVNPDGVRQQVEGSITMGLGYALTEEVRFGNGQIFDHNFDSYQIPRFSWVPAIETVLIDHPDAAPVGCGEPPIITLGGVIANAVYASTGARMRQLPMTPARIRAGLRPV